MKNISKRQKEILDSMTAIEGEVRTVCKCDDCHKLFGQRFIPFGIGRGVFVNLCLCQITGHRGFKEVARMEP